MTGNLVCAGDENPARQQPSTNLTDYKSVISADYSKSADYADRESVK
ncbi:hypothetical protein [Paenibacillus sp. FSL R7-0179]